MGTCKYCGASINWVTDEFGQRRPYGCGCSGSNDSGWKREASVAAGERRFWGLNDSVAGASLCPKCGAAVYFVRHNGGSVWLDELGWPWPIHPCFAKESERDWESHLREKMNGLRHRVSQLKRYEIRGLKRVAVIEPPEPKPLIRRDAFVGVVIRTIQLQPFHQMTISVAADGQIGAKAARRCFALSGLNKLVAFNDVVLVVDLQNGAWAASNYQFGNLDLLVKPKAADFGLPNEWSC